MSLDKCLAVKWLPVSEVNSTAAHQLVTSHSKYSPRKLLHRPFWRAMGVPLCPMPAGLTQECGERGQVLPTLLWPYSRSRSWALPNMEPP